MLSATFRPTAAARSGCGILGSMFTFRTRRRWWWLGAITTALAVSVAAVLLRPMLEHGGRPRIESEAVRHGAVARIGVVHVGVWPLLRLEGFDLDLSFVGRLRGQRGPRRPWRPLPGTRRRFSARPSGPPWWSPKPACQSASWRLRWA